MRRAIVLCFFALSVVLSLSGPIFAKPAYLKHIKNVYGLGDAVKCTLCHDVKDRDKPGKKNLGSYGKEYQTAMGKLGKDNLDAIVKSLENGDSDGDGATNLEELKLGTLPGSAESVPAKDLLEKYRKANPPSAKK